MDAQVTREDQNNINAFSKLNWQLTHQEEVLAEKKQELSYLMDSINELELYLDEEDISCKVGDSFVSMPLDKVNQHLANLQKELSEQILNIETRCETIKSELSRLKVLLYGKFKNSIHLESD
jgi:prefoldin subunit 4